MVAIWAPAVSAGRGGAAGGAAAMAPPRVQLTAPPGRQASILHPGRAMAALAHWRIPGGVESITRIYLDVELKLAGENIDIFNGCYALPG